ncbi:response regulator [Methylobacterium frigidaeris]|uniref:Response regulatory domain-containing protein n=1 Tax=Methylobacterium frigidaeris TaxID=2038277 RepID=A0AA37HH97_9HYPH|nr:response regulator [Methylobacterium frigidaeris]GJD66072.1 hypothetical protein MPEAHAMD_6268 [Methylobacterium frigidaeris]
MTDIDPEQQRAVILVEEEADEREAIAALLIEAGFKVAQAATTDEGLALLTTHKAAAALVTDAHVPGSIDGWELAQEARQRWPEMAVILTSGHSDATSGPLPDGAEFVLKPDIVGTLAPMLRRLTVSGR